MMTSWVTGQPHITSPDTSVKSHLKHFTNCTTTHKITQITVHSECTERASGDGLGHVDTQGEIAGSAVFDREIPVVMANRVILFEHRLS